LTRPPTCEVHNGVPFFGSTFIMTDAVFREMSIWREYLMLSGLAVVVLT